MTSDSLILKQPTSDLSVVTDDLRPVESRVADRYGKAADAGWSPLPDVLLFNQHKLKIAGDDLVVLLNMMAHYYTKNEMPFTRVTTIAKRMGVSQRTVERSIARLRKQGLILKAKHKENGQIVHDLAPPIQRLQPFAEERIADRKARQEYNRSVAQRIEPSVSTAGSDPRSARLADEMQVQLLPLRPQ